MRRASVGILLSVLSTASSLTPGVILPSRRATFAVSRAINLNCSRRFPHRQQLRLAMSGGGGSVVKPVDVLEFWFGKNFTEGKFDAMESAEYKKEWHPKWFFSNPEFDKEIFDKFAETIRAASNEGLSTGEWAEPNGLLARIILFDQLSRNAFRKQPEAFKYDQECLVISRRVVAEEGLLDKYPTFGIMFAGMPLMHSEKIEDHEMLDRVLSARSGKSFLAEQLQFLRDHTAVIKQFGRYPHRNAHYGRENTPEEEEWLERDDIPGWAKSQIKKKE